MATAKISPQLAQKLYELTPCAIHLYIWLLTQAEAGEVQEVFLEEFNPPPSYDIKTVKRALALLVEKGRVEVVRSYSSKIFKLITHDGSTQDLSEQEEGDE